MSTAEEPALKKDLHARIHGSAAHDSTVGRVTVGNFGVDFVSSDYVTAIPADGATHYPTVHFTSPPAWLDVAGNILVAGLYTAYVQTIVNAAFTTSALIGVGLPFAGYGLTHTGLSVFGTTADIQALGSGDLPYGVTWSLTMPTDATGKVDSKLSIGRAAY